MKIYKHAPLYLIQLTFRRGDEHVIHLTLCDTTIDQTLALLQRLFPDNTVKKDRMHKKTRIEIRERIGGKNGRYLAHSFYGKDIKTTRGVVFDYVTKLNSK